jgi:hypothetical protein
LSVLVVSLVLLFRPGLTRADFVYDFSSPPPPNFITFGLMANGTPAPAFESTVEGGVLKFNDTILPSAGGTALGIGTVADQQFADVRVRGTLNASGGSHADVVLLARADVSTLTTYAAGINFGTTGSGAGDAYIVKFINGNEIQDFRSSDPEQGAQPKLDINSPYYLQFDVVADLLTLHVFDAPGGNEVAHVSWIDPGLGGPILTTGTAGLGAQVIGNTPLYATFDNLAAAALVPEPTAALAPILAATMLIARTRARSK